MECVLYLGATYTWVNTVISSPFASCVQKICTLFYLFQVEIAPRAGGHPDDQNLRHAPEHIRLWHKLGRRTLIAQDTFFSLQLKIYPAGPIDKLVTSTDIVLASAGRGPVNDIGTSNPGVSDTVLDLNYFV